MSPLDDYPESAASAVHPTEWMIVVVLILLGIVLRGWNPDHLAVEHFDEGVYASNLFCPPANAYPFRHFYAPPLLPALLEWALILSGGAAGAVMAVNLVAGCCMVPSVWWVGRRWFGPAAGMGAAAFCALSPMHILYSRTALTDGLLCLWMLWGVYWAWRALIARSAGAILLAGLMATLAWWTKYNGWLTLAVSGSGTVAWLVAERMAQRHRPSAPHPITTLLRWAGIATLAFVGWLPYLVELQDLGGYAAVAENHARYFVGWAGWTTGFLRQSANLQFIEPPGLWAGLAVGGIGFVTFACIPERKQHRRQFQLISMLAILIAWGTGTILVVVGLTLVGLAIAIVRHFRRRTEQQSALAVWMLAAWFVGLLVAIPLYTPYPRLSLPLLVASWLGAGLGLQAVLQQRPEGDPTTSSPSTDLSPGWLATSGCALLLAAAGCLITTDRIALEDRTGLQTIARQIHQTLPGANRVIVTVLGEPGLFFHLAAQSHPGHAMILPGGDLASLSPPDPSLGPVTRYAVLGPHVLSAEGDSAAGISWAEAHLIDIEEWPYARSKLVLLNEHSPGTIETGDLTPQTIRLCRISE